MLATTLRSLCRSRTCSGMSRFLSSTAMITMNKQDPIKHEVTRNKPRSMTCEISSREMFSMRSYSQTHNDNNEQIPISERIEKLVKNNKVVVFMKGVPEQPMCGFSNAVVQVLRMHGVEGYDAHNVLEDEELRQGIKDFSDWPTIPQVYFNGEFIGGCDILLQMHQSGDLIEEFEKLGIKSALVK